MRSGSDTVSAQPKGTVKNPMMTRNAMATYEHNTVTAMPWSVDTQRKPATQLKTADLIDRLDPPKQFNFQHFRMRHMIAELLRTKQRRGIATGQLAPDVELQTSDGKNLRLSDLRGRPVLLHFVNYTCPVTRGGASVLKELHRQYGAIVQFVDVFVRQAHPGGRHGPYRSMSEKIREAKDYRREESIPWPVVVDDLNGTV
jgi:thiol-disulfide isomerase/thioredoxin